MWASLLLGSFCALKHVFSLAAVMSSDHFFSSVAVLLFEHFCLRHPSIFFALRQLLRPLTSNLTMQSEPPFSRDHYDAWLKGNNFHGPQVPQDVIFTHLHQINVWSFVIIDLVSSSNWLTDMVTKSIKKSCVDDICNKLDSYDACALATDWLTCSLSLSRSLVLMTFVTNLTHMIHVH